MGNNINSDGRKSDDLPPPPQPHARSERSGVSGFFVRMREKIRRALATLCGKSALLKTFQSFHTRHQGDEEELRKASEELVGRFLETGSGMEEMLDLSDRLGSQSEQLLNRALGKEQPYKIRTPGAHVLKWLQSLDQTQKEISPLIAGMQKQRNRIDMVLAQKRNLDRIMGMLKLLPSLFLIESASLSGANQRLFKSLVGDIKRIDVQISESLEGHFQVIDKLGIELRDGHKRFGRSLQEKCSQIIASKRRIEESIASNTADLDSNQKENTALIATTERVSSRTGSVVMALQVQDFTKQRLDHQFQLQGEISSRLKHAKIAPEDIQFCQEAARLSAAQTEAIDEDLAEACHTVGVGISAIQSDLRSMQDTCTSLRQFTNVAITADGFIQTVLDGFGEIRSMAADLIDAAQNMQSFLVPLEGALSKLSVTMRSLSWEIRLIALNAQVQAIQNGVGTGLEVLSAHTGHLADELFAIGGTLSEQLQEITSQLAEDVSYCQTTVDTAKGVLSAIDEQGEKDIATLHHYRDGALETLMEVTTVSERIAKIADDVDVKRLYHNLAKPALAAAAGTMTELAEAIAQHRNGAALPLAAGESLEHVRDQYSIQSEHAVHDKLYGRRTSSPAPDSAAASTATQPRPDPAGQDDDIMLFDDDTPDSAKDATDRRRQTPELSPVSSTSDLDDNIELF